MGSLNHPPQNPRAAIDRNLLVSYRNEGMTWHAFRGLYINAVSIVSFRRTVVVSHSLAARLKFLLFIYFPHNCATCLGRAQARAKRNIKYKARHLFCNRCSWPVHLSFVYKLKHEMPPRKKSVLHSARILPIFISFAGFGIVPSIPKRAFKRSKIEMHFINIYNWHFRKLFKWLLVTWHFLNSLLTQIQNSLKRSWKSEYRCIVSDVRFRICPSCSRRVSRPEAPVTVRRSFRNWVAHSWSF